MTDHGSTFFAAIIVSRAGPEITKKIDQRQCGCIGQTQVWKSMINRLTNFMLQAAGMSFGCLGLITGLIIVTSGTAHAQAVGTQKPNILFIMGDDIGWMQPSI